MRVSVGVRQHRQVGPFSLERHADGLVVQAPPFVVSVVRRRRPSASARLNVSRPQDCVHMKVRLTEALSMPITLDTLKFRERSRENVEIKGRMPAINRPIAGHRLPGEPALDRNGRAFRLMGGGYDGMLVEAPAVHQAAPASRHRRAGATQRSAATPVTRVRRSKEALASTTKRSKNYFGDEFRKTRDVAIELVRQRYGTQPFKVPDR